MSTLATDRGVVIRGPGVPRPEPRLGVRQPDSKSRAASLQVMAFGCGAVADVDPQALVLTYWFDAPVADERGPVAIRFSGRHAAARAKPGTDEAFSVVKSVEVIPGSGPVAVTARVEGIRSGDWQVSARIVSDKPHHHRRATRSAPSNLADRALTSTSGRTTYGPVASVLAPGARLGAWPLFVGFGLLMALVVQGLVARHLELRVWPLLVISILASVIGLVGAKLYYATGHYIQGERRPRQLLSGACIQGFVLGAVATLVVGTRVGHLPLGSALDATAPALMVGMAVGRYGCFFGGCCAGRLTSSRWALWSSDRRVGARRIPVQLFESAVALVIGVAASLALWVSKSAPAGAVFVGTIASYTLGRQLLVPLRARPRHTAHGRILVLGACAVVIAIDIVVAFTV